MKTYISLAGAIYETFKDVIGTKEEIQLHEDVYVKRKLRDVIGAKEFRRFDEMDEKYWNDAWREFDVMTFERR
ncbi:hypothetical protein [Paenibacillus sp. FSL E2-0178]|uniref:hypothetical protein n=1 Tax=Paenibacillus sp. FSL E2-0178 TaxID=2921361 RepID=UPI003158D05B